jgi:hypothetical protein
MHNRGFLGLLPLFSGILVSASWHAFAFAFQRRGFAMGNPRRLPTFALQSCDSTSVAATA